jgi:hypothetical protein
MKRAPYRKRFKGLVSFGTARFAMMHEHWKTLRNMAAKGWQTPLETMESHANMQRKFRRKAA